MKAALDSATPEAGDPARSAASDALVNKDALGRLSSSQKQRCRDLAEAIHDQPNPGGLRFLVASAFASFSG